MIWIIGIELIIIIYLIIKGRKMATSLETLQAFATRINNANVELTQKYDLIIARLNDSVSSQDIINVLETPVSNIEAKINEINPEQ